jgi:hypothetical protein
MSRQRKFQLKMKALGLCQACGKPANGLSKCPDCLMKQNEARRVANGHNAWTEGSRGRPPKYTASVIVLAETL